MDLTIAFFSFFLLKKYAYECVGHWIRQQSGGYTLAKDGKYIDIYLKTYRY